MNSESNAFASPETCINIQVTRASDREVFSIMQEDEISDIAKNDPLILMPGQA